MVEPTLVMLVATSPVTETPLMVAALWPASAPAHTCAPSVLVACVTSTSTSATFVTSAAEPRLAKRPA